VLPIGLLNEIDCPPHVRIFAVLVRHVAMRSTPQLELGRKMWKEAAIPHRETRRRAVNHLEECGAIRVERRLGKTSIVSLNVDRRGRPRLWRDLPELKAVPEAG
jgi:hypothetical protein